MESPCPSIRPACGIYIGEAGGKPTGLETRLPASRQSGSHLGRQGFRLLWFRDSSGRMPAGRGPSRTGEWLDANFRSRLQDLRFLQRGLRRWNLCKITRSKQPFSRIFNKFAYLRATYSYLMLNDLRI